METKALPEINIVVPLYNEESVFNHLKNRLLELIHNCNKTIEVIMIDDGSSDKTEQLMTNLSVLDEHFQSVILSRNFGHQNALTAGFNYVNATRAIMVIDSDLQDPPELLNDFLKYFDDGYDVVYAVRKKRETGLFLRIAYSIFYKIIKNSSYIDIPLDSGDFCLMSRRVVDHINAMPEESRFIRGMRAWIGYKQIGIEYDRPQRISGESKYTLRKLLSLALNGLFNFSKYPIRITMLLGIITILISLFYFVITIIKKIFIGDVPSGFTALLFTIILFGGIQLIAIGTIGEYILRIFFQVKKRPLFIVKKRICNKKETVD